MKIGMCVNMFQSPADSTGLGVLDYVKKAGFDYVEAPAAQLMALTDAELDNAVERIKAAGLPCLSFNNLFGAAVPTTGPKADDARIDDYIDRVCALAARLGAETFVFGSTASRNVPMGFPFEQAWRQLVNMLRRLGPKAEKAGVTVAIEHVNRLEGNIVAAFREGVRLMREVGHPAVRVLVDSFHLGLGNECMDYVELNFNELRHAHFSNILARSLAIESRHEQGGLDYLAMLRHRGYQFKLSCEGYSNDPEKEIPEAAAFLRKRV